MSGESASEAIDASVAGSAIDAAAFQALIRAAVAENVRRRSS
jgi:hypothetical protein